MLELDREWIASDLISNCTKFPGVEKQDSYCDRRHGKWDM